MSKHAALMDMLSAYEKILHPDFFNGIKKKVIEAYEENREDAFKNAGISEQARLIDAEIERIKDSLSRQPRSSHKTWLPLHMKSLYKWLLQNIKF